MASGVFNQARGRVNEFVQRVIDNDPTDSALVIVALAEAEADAALMDRDDLAAILAAASTAEATNTGYDRLVVDDSDPAIAVNVDDANDRTEADFSDQSWSAVSAGDNWVKALICYTASAVASAVDGNIVPLTFHDFAQNPNGGSIALNLGPFGFYRARKA